MKRTGKKGGRLYLQLLLLMPVLTLLLAAIGAKLIDGEVLGEEAVNALAPVIAALSAFSLALYAALRSPQKKFLWAVTTAVAYACLLLLGNLLFFGVGFGPVLPVLASVLTAGLLGGLLGSRKRRKYA